MVKTGTGMIICGIYEIKNIINGHRYIGSSKNINQRILNHKSLLKRNLHHSQHLQSAWNKYGKENFEFNRLEECTEEIIYTIEQKYLDLNPEYNICKYIRSHPMTNDIKSKLSCIMLTTKALDKYRKAVYMIDINTNKVVKEFKSLRRAALYTGHLNHRTFIRDVIRGKYPTAYGYKWKLINNE